MFILLAVFPLKLINYSFIKSWIMNSFNYFHIHPPQFCLINFFSLPVCRVVPLPVAVRLVLLQLHRRMAMEAPIRDRMEAGHPVVDMDNFRKKEGISLEYPPLH
jgi:hypothetical protein